MSTLKAINLQHPTASTANITLSNTGGIALNGSVSGGGMDLITPTSVAGTGVTFSGGAISFSAATSISVNGCFSSVYQNYKILIDYTSPGAPGFYYRFRTGGVDNSTSNYQWQRHQASGASVTAALASSQNTLGGWGITASFPIFQQIELNNPFESAYTTGWYSWARMNSLTNTDVEQGTNIFSLTTSFDGITFYPSTSTLTGSLRIYGYKKS